MRIVLAVTAVSLSALSCTGRSAPSPSPSAAPPKAASAIPTPVPTEWSYPNERAWIVSATARDVAEMLVHAHQPALARADALRFSTAGQPEAAGGPRFTVSFEAQGRREYALTLADHLWAPAGYEPLAAGLIRDLGLKPAPPAAEPRVLAVLLDPRSSVLERESRRVSRGLAESMLQPVLHEEAGLILGTLALREASGRFSDTRHTLCRMSAHLAVARALRQGAPSELADYGEALLLTLVNRQKDALERVALLEKAAAAPERAAWLRVLRMRNTGDWRILRQPARSSLLERLEHLRALQGGVGGSQAMNFLDSFKAEPMGDWARLALQARTNNEQGNIFIRSVTGSDLADAAATWKAFHGTVLPPEQLVEALNTVPERLMVSGEDKTAQPRVIGWGSWARYFQRNLCFDAQAVVGFIDATGLAGEGILPRREELDRRFSVLALWPRVALEWEGVMAPYSPAQRGTVAQASLEAKRQQCLRAEELIRRTPELVPPEPLWVMHEACAFMGQTKSSTPSVVARWLDLPAPAGTALTNGDTRIAWFDLGPERPRVLAELHGRAPFDHQLIQVIERDPPLTFEALAALYGPLAEYNLRAMERLASGQPDAASARALYTRMAALEPDRNLDLGDYLVDLGEEAAAARAYEEAAKRARNRMAVAGGMMWLVGYHLENGRAERAHALAESAAAVGSREGIATMGYLMERLGRYDQAVEWYRRSGDPLALASFFVRYLRKVGDQRFGGEATAAMAELFPRGFEKVTLDQLTGPPDPASVMVTGLYARSTRFGLRKGDLVVALNGYRARGHEQYQCLWTLDDSPEAVVIVWRDGRYVEVKGRMNDARYGLVRRVRA